MGCSLTKHEIQPYQPKDEKETNNEIEETESQIVPHFKTSCGNETVVASWKKKHSIVAIRNNEENENILSPIPKQFDTELCRIYSLSSSCSDKLTIIHFNDVYNIESRDEEPVGGAARFVAMVKRFPGEPLILFSGDCLNPSLSKFRVPSSLQ